VAEKVEEGTGDLPEGGFINDKILKLNSKNSRQGDHQNHGQPFSAGPACLSITFGNRFRSARQSDTPVQ